jgi:hypothetical protein
VFKIGLNVHAWHPEKIFLVWRQQLKASDLIIVDLFQYKFSALRRRKGNKFGGNDQYSNAGERVRHNVHSCS